MSEKFRVETEQEEFLKRVLLGLSYVTEAEFKRIPEVSYIISHMARQIIELRSQAHLKRYKESLELAHLIEGV